MIRVEPDPGNRALLVTATDEDGFVVRRSLEQLEGAASPRTRWLQWARVPPGALTVAASVYGGGSSTPLATAKVTMLIVARRGAVDSRP
jgi:hypothetical protein